MGEIKTHLVSYRVILIVFFMARLSASFGQDVNLGDLLFFQTKKNSIKIDSVLLTKKKWECNCFRECGDISRVTHWIYDLQDTSLENIEKDYIKKIDLGKPYSSVINFYTSDGQKGKAILSEMQTLPEEKIQEFKSDSLHGRLSFFIAEDVVIQSVIGEDIKAARIKFLFILMDKEDYLKGLMIK